MIEHHIQKKIVRLLGATESAHFSEIKPEGLENNAFQYHLKQLIAAGIIEKNKDGTYDLTSKGTGEYIVSHLSRDENAMQAHAVLLLAVQRDDKWLLATRAVKPQQGQAGFLHGEPVWNEDILATATQRLQAKTGLRADFEVKGNGFIRITEGGAYSSFVQATLLYATNPTGDFDASGSYTKIDWYSTEELQKLALIPSMPHLFEVLQGTKPTFFDLSFELT